MFKQRCLRFTWKNLVLAAATGFGLGFSPFASGTTGALLGLPLMLALAPIWATGRIMAQTGACLVLAAGAVGLCDLAEKHLPRKDDPRIVADEYLTFPIGLIGLPLCLPALLLAFITNRIGDILKPFPAWRAQKLPGGLGIVADDFISAGYSLVINHLLFPIVIQHWPFI